MFSVLQAPAAGVPDFRDLLQAGQYGFGSGTFETALAPGSYVVTLTVGDAQGRVTGMTATANGTPVTFTLGDGSSSSVLSTTGDQFLTASFPVTVNSSGLMSLTMQGAGGTGVWIVNGLTIRTAQAPLTLSVSTPALDSNGIPAVTVSGSGATPDSLVTVGTTLGTITSADQEGNYAGTQVLADTNGDFSYTVETRTAGATTFSAQEVTGASFGQTTVSINPPPPTITLPLNFDFNASFNANGGPGPSPTQSGPFTYTSVVSTAYSPGLGYGWLGTLPANYDRGAATLQPTVSGAPNFQPLLEAFNYGQDNTFEVDLPGSTTYTITVTMGDTGASHGPVDIFSVVNGVATQVTSITLGDGTVVSSIYSPANQFITGTFQVTAPAGSGLQPVELEFKPAAGAADFVLNSLDIVQNQEPITLAQTGSSEVNGFEVVTVTGSGAVPDSLVTVSSDAGTVSADVTGQTITDDDLNYAGTQVSTDAIGDFTFVVQTQSTAGSGTVSAHDVTGVAAGSGTISYAPVVSYQLDFKSGTSNQSPTASGYTAVLPTGVYGSATTPHFGWSTSLDGDGFDNGSDAPVVNGPNTSASPDANLLADGVSSGSATFLVDVTAATNYHLHFYLGDGQQAHFMQITVVGLNGGQTVQVLPDGGQLDPQNDNFVIVTGTPGPGGPLGHGQGGFYQFDTGNFTTNSATQLQITFTGLAESDARGVGGRPVRGGRAGRARSARAAGRGARHGAGRDGGDP